MTCTALAAASALAPPCAADLEPAVIDCFGCDVLTDANDLDDEGLCRACAREAEAAALEAATKITEGNADA